MADFLGLKPSRAFDLGAIRGLTTYPNGHSVPHEFRRTRKGEIGVGMLPITQHLVHWFVALPTHLLSGKLICYFPKLISLYVCERNRIL